MDIKGKTAIITGAASGIGLATAREFIKHGIEAVALVDRSPAVAEHAATLNAEAGRSVALPPCSAKRRATCAAAIAITSTGSG